MGEKNIVAVLNAEMMGRNAPDSASLLGRQRPHRNSLDLVTTALAANQGGPKFKLDTLWDRAVHPEELLRGQRKPRWPPFTRCCSGRAHMIFIRPRCVSQHLPDATVLHAA